MTSEWDNYQSAGNSTSWRIENLNLKRFAGQDKTLLDIGANQGEFGLALSKYFKHITLVEPEVEAPILSENMTWVAKGFKDFISESNDTYDVVLSFAVTRLIWRGDNLNEHQIAKEYYDLVKPNGILVYETHLLDRVTMLGHTARILTKLRQHFGDEIESDNSRSKRMYYIFKKLT